MSCEAFEERIARHVDGEFDPEVEEHLESCPVCSSFAGRLEGDRVALRTPPLPEVDFAAMRRQIRARIVRERRQRLAPVWLAVAASVLLAVIGMRMHRTAPQPVPHTVTVLEHQVGQALPPAPAGQKPAPPKRRLPKPDPVLEAALRDFLAAEQLPPPPPPAPAQIRIATNDPDIVLILVQESTGAPQ